jgi:N12 class adenine-specific DNA methylase
LFPAPIFSPPAPVPPPALPYEHVLQPLLRTDPGTPLGDVPVADIAYGAYAAVTGYLPDGRDLTLTGYLIRTWEAVADYEDWTRDACFVVTLADRPTASDGAALAVPLDAQATILPAPPGSPPAVAAPWRQMPVDEQVVAGLAEVGLILQQVADHRGLPGWQISSIDRVFTGRNPHEQMAGLLFGRDVWRGRTRPLLRQEFVDQAIAEDRWHGTDALGPTLLRDVRSGANGSITGTVDEEERTIAGAFDRVWSGSHGDRRQPTVNVVVAIAETRPGSLDNRVISVAVPAAGAEFTVTARPAEPTSGAHPTASAAAESLPTPEEVTAPPEAEPRPTPTAAAEPPVSPPADVLPFAPHGQSDLAPSGAVSRVRANVAALRTLRTIQAEARPATADEQPVLARWSGWGAVPAVFDSQAARYDRFAWAREELVALLNSEELAAAARNTLNAHYTDASYVEAIWDTVAELGFEGGRVLEPGSGSGNFIAFAPPGADMVGVELEPVTAALSQALYPRAQILNESFADTRAPEATFDLVVGNVPFGPVALHDKRHNAAGHSIHNHFIIKALHLVKPGGLVAVVTSSYTMDTANPGARREMAGLADLVGAVRLPSGAHRRAAGTDVVTDVLVLRRREDDREPVDTGWEQSHLVEVDGISVRVNEYFVNRPQYVLGEFGIGGMHGREELTVVGDRDAAPALRTALRQIVEAAQRDGLTHSQQPPDPTARPVALVARASSRPDGYLQVEPDGGFTRVEQGTLAAYQPAATQAAELRALLGLRDTEVALLEAEAVSLDDTDDIDDLRRKLNTAYDAYLDRYGPINRFTERATGRTDAETGAPVMARIRPRQGGFRDDPFSNLVYALEDFDSTKQTAAKADIFGQRVVAPRAARLGADTPADALAICLDNHGAVQLDEIARLLGVDEDTARAGLGELVYDEPGTDRLVPAPEYLSGHIRVKLAEAQKAAENDPRFEVNATALAASIPRDLTPDEIEAKLGASWISAGTVRQFLAETLDDPDIQVQHAGGAMWAVKSARRRSVAATSQWGIPSYPAPDIAQAVLEQRQIRIYDEFDDGVRVFNPDRTIAAQQKAQELADRFAEWAWEDPKRGAELTAIYNEKFNSLVLRSYDNVPLTLPGLSLTFKPFPHQIAAVARVIAEPSVGLFHTVGAGKTAEMAMAAMELRRLGMANKPAIVVPNHMLEQFGREFLQLYPQAKILAASTEDLSRERRRLFVGRCATGEWDAVVITRSAFERIQMSPEVQKAYLQREVDAIEAQLDKAQDSGERLMIKRLEAMKLRVEERLKNKLDSAKDPGITFEKTGIDYLFIDEAHGFKNLRTPSNVPNMSVDGSQRSSDLHMKIEWLRERSDRVATLATGTPIANSMGEAYTMLRYLRPDLLDAVNITSFDSFAATFGTLVTQIEVAPEGGMRMNTRFAKFVNVPELLRMWHVAGDIKMADDLKLPVPAQAERPGDGERAAETVVVPSSDALHAFIGLLADRADRVRNRQVDPDVDNLLKITSEGRAAALDLRLVGGTTDERSKIDVAADRIHDIWSETRDRIYRAPSGEDHPTPGALQIVFADLGTPKPGRWSVYEELREQLVARGMPREQVRFIHEARNDREKGDLFAAARDGRISVLIGSTERMGVGTNVQARAVALHHLDCPWRPADLEQREGRILRQGNQNDEVRILRYVTEGSFDGYSWQTVTRKAQFIAQVMRGKLDVREIEDIGDSALSYNEVKALATGNPLLLDQAQAQADFARLERLERSYHSGLNSLQYTIREAESNLTYLHQRVTDVDAALARRLDVHGDAFTMTINGQRLDNRAEATQQLRDVLSEQLDHRTFTGRVIKIGSFGGFVLTATVSRSVKDIPFVDLELVGVPQGSMNLDRNDVVNASLVTRLENRLTGLEQLRANAERDIPRRQEVIAQAQVQLDQPFRQADALREARGRLDEIDALLADSSRNATPTPTAPAPGLPLPVAPRADAVAVDRMLQLAVAAAEQHGWVSRNDAGGDPRATSTASLVEQVINGSGDAVTQLRRELDALITPAVVERAAAIRAWATGLSAERDDEYAADLSAAARADMLPPHRLALLVSAVGTYQHYEQTEAQRQAAAGSEWQGAVGVRMTAEVQVQSSRSFTHNHGPHGGTSTALRMLDDAGNLYSWVSSNALDTAPGHRLEITGTVKAHTDWQDCQETQLTRCTYTVLADRVERPAGASPTVDRSAPPAPEDPIGQSDVPIAQDAADPETPAIGTALSAGEQNEIASDVTDGDQEGTIDGTVTCGGDPFAPFTARELAVIRHAVEDWAGNYYGTLGELHFDRDDAERYVAEGHLQQLGTQHRLAVVWRAVAAHLDVHPEILEAGRLNDAQRAANQQERVHRGGQLALAAHRAFMQGDYRGALDLVDAGERETPEGRASGMSWDSIRDRINAEIAARSSGTPPSDGPEPGSVAGVHAASAAEPVSDLDLSGSAGPRAAEAARDPSQQDEEVATVGAFVGQAFPRSMRAGLVAGSPAAVTDTLDERTRVQPTASRPHAR